MKRADACFWIIVGSAFTAISPVSAIAQTYVVHKIAPTLQKGYDEVHISKAAVAGQQVRLWAATLLNADCTTAGTIDTKVIDQPRHGQLSISDAPIYPNFSPPNPRAVCDTRKAPGKQAFYTPDASFHGHDKLVIENATSEGKIRRVIFDVDVR